jgi:hypothetical protein
MGYNLNPNLISSCCVHVEFAGRVKIVKLNFMPILHPFIIAKIAIVFMNNIFKLHGKPVSIISDRDKFSFCKSFSNYKAHV